MHGECRGLTRCPKGLPRLNLWAMVGFRHRRHSVHFARQSAPDRGKCDRMPGRFFFVRSPRRTKQRAALNLFCKLRGGVGGAVRIAWRERLFPAFADFVTALQSGTSWRRRLLACRGHFIVADRDNSTCDGSQLRRPIVTLNQGNPMNTRNDASIRVLKHLIETCKDGRHGFQTAAEDAETPELQQVFTDYSRQRDEFISELQAQVAALGGNPDESGSAAGALHRGWINLKSAISSNEPHAVLEECERGEDAAVKAYKEALANRDLDVASRSIISEQYTAIQAARDRVKSLRDSLAYSSKS